MKKAACRVTDPVPLVAGGVVAVATQSVAELAQKGERLRLLLRVAAGATRFAAGAPGGLVNPGERCRPGRRALPALQTAIDRCLG